MIERIITAPCWAASFDETLHTGGVTIYIRPEIPRPTVLATIELARVMGSGWAEGIIYRWDYQRESDDSVLTMPPAIFDVNNPARLVKRDSYRVITDVVSINFVVRAINMFAYAICKVFVYEPLSPFTCVLRAESMIPPLIKK